MASLISKKFFCSKFKNIFKIAIFCFTALTVAGCEAAKDLNPWESYPVPPCPKIQLLKDTDVITVFRSGVGRDITDIRYEAEVNGFTGNCEYIGKKGLYSKVKLVIKVEFEITRGPAAQSRLINFSYFVAIPEFYPKPSGRKIFVVKVKFPENRNTVRIVDEEVEISIPLNGSRKGPGSEIYIGFQLTPDQLKLNRQNRQTPRIK